MNEYIIYTDGALATSTNNGGYCFIILKDNKEKYVHFNSVKNTTVNRMELGACITALSAFNTKQKITIYSDSQYVVKGYNDNWKKTKNRDLWKVFEKLISEHDVTLKWVKGHNKNKYNEKADFFALYASQL